MQLIPAPQTYHAANMITEGRYGYIEITEQLLREHPEGALKALSALLVISIDRQSFYNTYRYYGYSPMFLPVPEGSAAPRYIVKVCSDGSIIYTN